MMIISARKWFERLKYVFLFLLFTYIISRLFFSLGEWLSPLERYQSPEGGAEKVFLAEEHNQQSMQMFDRLLLFYWIGE